MNILFITPSIPSRLHRIRSYDLIKVLSKKHEVHLLSLDSKKEELPRELIKSVKTFDIVYKSKWKSFIDCFVYLFSSFPLEVSYCRSTEMKKKVKEIIKREKIDLIYVKRLRSYQFACDFEGIIPIIIDTTDAMSLFYKRALNNSDFLKKFLFFEEYLKYVLYEKKIFKKNKNWITCSKIDADHLSNRFNVPGPYVIPNVVDTTFFQNTDKNLLIESQSLLFSGLMDKYVNIEGADFFIKKVFPKILSKYPNTKLYIVGPNPVKQIKRYRSDNIIVTGFVNDLRDYIKKVEVVICPIITGTGVRNKILQAWAIGKPVVSTTVGWQGLGGEDGREIILADDPRSFADAVINLFESKQFSSNLAQNGKVFAESNYSETIISNKVEIFLQKTLNQFLR